MILLVTTSSHRYTHKKIIPARTGRGNARVVSYDWLFRQNAVRASCVVFTDLDRLRHYELAMAGQYYNRLRDGGIRVLNNPACARQRYDLLHFLHEAGINWFRAYRAVIRPKPAQFPVIIKCETDHAQPFDQLIADQATLERELDRIEESGVSLRNLLVIEFANEPIRTDVYLRKTMFRVGDTLVAGNPVIEDNPFVKYGTDGLTNDAEFVYLTKWMRTNPDADALRRVFEIARIEYGRADYGTDKHGIAVYEINTNPQIGDRIVSRDAEFVAASLESVAAVAKAIRALAGETRTVRINHQRRWFSRLAFKAGFNLKMP